MIKPQPAMDSLALQLMEVALRYELGREATKEEVEEVFKRYMADRAISFDEYMDLITIYDDEPKRSDVLWANERRMGKGYDEK